MSVTLNAFEVFEIAEQIERNGARFYRTAARFSKDGSAKQTLLRLADMEDNHERIYADMRKALTEQERELMAFDPQNDVAVYLQAMANNHVFDLKTTNKLTGKEKLADILNMAIGAEKDSIAFYTGLKNFVPSQVAKDKIEDVIGQEMGHIIILNRQLASCK